MISQMNETRQTDPLRWAARGRCFVGLLVVGRILRQASAAPLTRLLTRTVQEVMAPHAVTAYPFEFSRCLALALFDFIMH